MHRVFLAVACALLIPAAVSAQTWHEVRSPQFVVLTDGGEGRGREVAWQFEQIRAAVLAAFPWARPQLDRPVVIVAARDENSMRQLLPVVFKQSSRDILTISIASVLPDRHVIVLQSDHKSEDVAGTINPYFASYTSYSQLMLNAAFERPLPRWFVRGLSAVLGNSLVKRNEIDFGRPIPWMVQSLNESRAALPALLEMTADDPYLRSDVNRQRFDAQSWGLVHYLLFGRPANRADAINQISKMLAGGRTSTEAVTQVFGSVSALDEAYREFQRRPITQFARLAIDTAINRDTFALRAMPPEEVATMRALVHVAFGDPSEAKAMLVRARPGGTEPAESYAVEALLLDRERQGAAALAAYRKAVELKSRNFYPHFRVALEMTQPGTRSDREGAERHFRESIALNAEYAFAHAMLANLLVVGPRPESAVEPARRAVLLDPGDPQPRLILANVLRRTGQLAAANGIAMSARLLARSDTDRSNAQSIIDQIAADMAKATPALPGAPK